MSQLFVPAGHRVRIPATMLLGALILLVADTLTRTFLIGNTFADRDRGLSYRVPYFLFLDEKSPTLERWFLMDKAKLRQKIGDLAYEVTQNAATERAFTGKI